MVEAIDLHPAELGAAGEPAESCGRLVDGDRHAALRQAVARREAEQPAADDPDAHTRSLAATLRIIRRA